MKLKEAYLIIENLNLTSAWYYNGKLKTFNNITHANFAANNYQFFGYTKENFIKSFCYKQDEESLKDFQKEMAGPEDENTIKFLEELCMKGAIRLQFSNNKCWITIYELDKNTKDSLIEMLEFNKNIFSKINSFQLYDIENGFYYDNYDSDEGIEILAKSLKEFEQKIENY